MDSSDSLKGLDIGDRVVPTAEYLEAFPLHRHAASGRIVGFCPWWNGIVVLWDGRKTRMSLHQKFLRKEERPSVAPSVESPAPPHTHT